MKQYIRLEAAGIYQNEKIYWQNVIFICKIWDFLSISLAYTWIYWFSLIHKPINWGFYFLRIMITRRESLRNVFPGPLRRKTFQGKRSSALNIHFVFVTSSFFFIDLKLYFNSTLLRCLSIFPCVFFFILTNLKQNQQHAVPKRSTPKQRMPTKQRIQQRKRHCVSEPLPNWKFWISTSTGMFIWSHAGMLWIIVLLYVFFLPLVTISLTPYSQWKKKHHFSINLIFF